MKNIIMIPARMESSRLPGKPLLDIRGIPMIIHVAYRSRLSQLAQKVIVCTDSVEIARVCGLHGIETCLTADVHDNGTERLADACQQLDIDDSDLIVDVQGDEPLINPTWIDDVIAFHNVNKFECTVPYQDMYEKNNPNRVKLVVSGSRVINMTRADSPVNFGDAAMPLKKHLSVIAFSSATLKKYALLEKGPLERSERVELMRLIEHSLPVGTFRLSGESLSVDTREDYEHVCRMMVDDPISKNYLS